MSTKPKDDMRNGSDIFDHMFQNCKDVIYTINDKLTAIQVATENLWADLDKKDFYSIQQIETIIRSCDTIGSHIDALESAMTRNEQAIIEEIPAVSGIKKRVLLAEDDYDTANILKLMLQRANIEVTMASDGQAAFDFFKKEDFDLLISDVKMPRVDGLQLKKMVRQIDQDMPILFISGYERETTKEIAKNDENAYFLCKPFNHSDIINILEKTLL